MTDRNPMIVVLDSGIVGLITNPVARNYEARECSSWHEQCIFEGITFCLPEIIDYESRRDYLLRDARDAVARLDQLGETSEFLILNSEIMLDAASRWAETRKKHLPTAHEWALDVDVILAAQAFEYKNRFNLPLIVATKDIGDLTRLGLDARDWADIPNRR